MHIWKERECSEWLSIEPLESALNPSLAKSSESQVLFYTQMD